MINKLDHCRLCGSTKYSLLFSKDEYAVARCAVCGIVFLDFAADDLFFTQYYSQDFFNDVGNKNAYCDYEKEAKSLNKSFLKRIEIIQKYQPVGNLLDIGCATGAFMETASAHWQVSGVDVSRYATDEARKKGLTVFAGEVQESPYIDQKFDIVTMWDTIEHVAHPAETMTRVSKLIKPGGIVCLTTGDVGSVFSRLCDKFWHLYNIPQHLSYFDKNTITKLLNDAGFAVKEIRYLPLNLTLDYVFFRFINLYNLRFLMPFYNFLKRNELLNMSLDINLYDIMFVVGQK